MVVALDLESDRLAVSEVDDARVLSGALEYARSSRRKPAQEERRVLVRAVLGPEEREDDELELVRLALEQGANSLGLSVREPERAMKRRIGYRRQAATVAAPSDVSRPGERGPDRAR
jgi:hypothetical protein